jgi:hypothetical protein
MPALCGPLPSVVPELVFCPLVVPVVPELLAAPVVVVPVEPPGMLELLSLPQPVRHRASATKSGRMNIFGIEFSRPLRSRRLLICRVQDSSVEGRGD